MIVLECLFFFALYAAAVISLVDSKVDSGLEVRYTVEHGRGTFDE